MAQRTQYFKIKGKWNEVYAAGSTAGLAVQRTGEEADPSSPLYKKPEYDINSIPTYSEDQVLSLLESTASMRQQEGKAVFNNQTGIGPAQINLTTFKPGDIYKGPLTTTATQVTPGSQTPQGKADLAAQEEHNKAYWANEAALSASSLPPLSSYVQFDTANGPAYFQQGASGLTPLAPGSSELQQLKAGTLKATTSSVSDIGRSLNFAPITPYNSQTTSISSPISNSSLTPTASTNYATPTPTTPFDISSLIDSLFKPTKGEERETALSERLQKINTQLSGKAADTFAAEEAAGIPQIIKTQNDLTAQLQVLKNESEALKLEAEGIPIDIQQQSEGRGRTTGGVAPLTASAQRANTLKQLGLASQALTVASLLEATNGNLVNAQYMAERAIQQKYGPLEAEYEAQLRNLQLVQNSPEYKLADKERAAQIEMVISLQMDAIQEQKNSALTVQKIAIEAASTGQVPATVLEQIRKATDPIQAAQLAAPYLQQAEEQWSDPYYLGGDLVQTNLETNLTRLAVNVAARRDGVDYYPTFPPTSSPSPSSSSLLQTGGTKSVDFGAIKFDSVNVPTSTKVQRTTQTAKNKNYTAANIPDAVRNDLMQNIKRGVSREALFNGFPDVSTDHINSLYNQLVPKSDVSARIDSFFK